MFAWQYMHNKAIRDGKYSPRHMPVLGNVHTIKIENLIVSPRPSLGEGIEN